MKKKIFTVLSAVVLSICLTACGSNDVKVIENNKDDKAFESSTDNSGETSKLKGYVFEADGQNGKVSITTEIEMNDILKQLGDPDNYFEAESCAFKGLDKTYTYSHYEIQTYPEDKKDLISCILFKDDMIKTAEGLSIGMTKDQMEEAYGTDYEQKGAMYVYKKDSSFLGFIIQDNIISSIQYFSDALEQQQN